MMWGALHETMAGGSVQQVRLCRDGEPLSYEEVLDLWQRDHSFCAYFIALLADSPYQAFLWETPPLMRSTATRPFSKHLWPALVHRAQPGKFCSPSALKAHHWTFPAQSDAKRKMCLDQSHRTHCAAWSLE